MTDADIDTALDAPDPSEYEPDPDLPIRAEDVHDPELVAAAVEHMRQLAKHRTLKRFAGQMNTIDLASDVHDELHRITVGVEKGVLLETCITKLALDILAGNLQPRTLTEAAKAIDALQTAAAAVQGGMSSLTSSSAARSDTYLRITEFFESKKGDDAIPVETRDAIDVLAAEDDD